MKKLLFIIISFCFFYSLSFSQQIAEQKNLINKINQQQTKEELAVKEATIAKQEAQVEKNAQKEGLSPILKTEEKQDPQKKETATLEQEQKNIKADSKEVKSEQKQDIKVKKENPDPQGVDWIDLSKGKLDVKMQRRTNGVPTPNLSLKFNNVYQSLFRNIPWLMGGKAKVYVYQNRKNFLDHEAVASNWSGAFFSPENNRIVMYDEPNNTKKMISQFQHELTHLFLENYYSPQGSGRPEPPVWLNEGLAVNMEDISNKTEGDVWAHDLIVMNLIPSSKSPAASLRAPRPITNADVQFIKFTDFIKNNSYDDAVAAGKVQDWYMQAYAMVRFLFKPYNNQYPEKRIQFEQFTKLLNTYQNKRNSKGVLMKDDLGRQIKARLSVAAALKKVYGYNNIDDFETKFWQWLYSYQAEKRDKMND